MGVRGAGWDTAHLPWGNDDLDPERASYDQTYGFTTLAVGCFPRGSTPEGVLDLAGNVWEWTRSEYRAYPYDPRDGRENGADPARKPFTLRGGSWFGRPFNLRAACRDPNTPVNHYLHELDTFVNQDLRTGAYLRYADDWLLFSDDKARLHTWREAISSFLVGLRLVLHDRKTQIYPTATGVPFLGFRLYPEHRRLKRPNVIRFKRRMRRLFHRFADGQIPLEHVQASINDWVAHAAHGSTYRLREQLLGGLVVPRRGKP